MSDVERDAAWEKYAHDTTFCVGGGDDPPEVDVTDLVHEHWNLCWDAAYAAASADTDRLVRAAVEATITAAANANGDEWLEDCTDEGYFLYCPECDNVKEAGHSEGCIKGAIRALDIDAIVALVMQSK